MDGPNDDQHELALDGLVIDWPHLVPGAPEASRLFTVLRAEHDGNATPARART